MKKVIRRCVFETNSSMSHSLVIMTADENKRWENEKLYYYTYGWYNCFGELPEDQQPIKNTLYTEEEALNFVKLLGYEYEEDEYDTVDEFLRESDFYSYDDWHESEWEEYNSYTYTTKSGENLIIETKCGRDG